MAGVEESGVLGWCNSSWSQVQDVERSASDWLPNPRFWPYKRDGVLSGVKESFAVCESVHESGGALF